MTRYLGLFLFVLFACGAQAQTNEGWGSCTVSEDKGTLSGISMRCGDPMLDRLMQGYNQECVAAADPIACMQKYMPNDIEINGPGAGAPQAPRVVNSGGDGLHWSSNASQAEIDAAMKKLPGADSGKCTDAVSRLAALEDKLRSYQVTVADMEQTELQMLANGEEGYLNGVIGAGAGVGTAVSGAAQVVISGGAMVNPKVVSPVLKTYTAAKKAVDSASGNARQATEAERACKAWAKGSKWTGLPKEASQRMAASCAALEGANIAVEGAQMAGASVDEAGELRRKAQSQAAAVGARRQRMLTQMAGIQAEINRLEICAPRIHPPR
jgi:hypothetical protein